MPTKRATGSSDDLREQSRKDHQEFAQKSEPSPLADLPRRAAVMTPLLSDTLERVQGVARWGLNE